MSWPNDPLTLDPFLISGPEACWYHPGTMYFLCIRVALIIYSKICSRHRRKKRVWKKIGVAGRRAFFHKGSQKTSSNWCLRRITLLCRNKNTMHWKSLSKFLSQLWGSTASLLFHKLLSLDVDAETDIFHTCVNLNVS